MIPVSQYVVKTNFRLHFVRLVGVDNNLRFPSKRLFDTNRFQLPQTKRSWPAGGQCGRFCSIRSPSMYLTNSFTTCAIKSQPANMISFSINFRARYFESILVLGYATSSPSHCRFFTRFCFFRSAMRSSARH